MLNISQMLKGMTPQLVLASLLQGERYGYDIIQAIKNASEDVLQLGEGSVYPILHALEQKGFIASRWEIQKKGPARKYYRITSAGERELEKSHGQWKVFEGAILRSLQTFGV